MLKNFWDKHPYNILYIPYMCNLEHTDGMKDNLIEFRVLVSYSVTKEAAHAVLDLVEKYDIPFYFLVDNSVYVKSGGAIVIEHIDANLKNQQINDEAKQNNFLKIMFSAT